MEKAQVFKPAIISNWPYVSCHGKAEPLGIEVTLIEKERLLEL